METGLLHDFLGIFARQVKDISFTWRGGACEVRLNPCKVRLKWTLENSETRKDGGWVLALHKSGNELCLDLHKSGDELSLDLHKSGNELSLDLHINESPKWNSSLLDFYVSLNKD